jgi:hypothetical protein
MPQQVDDAAMREMKEVTLPAAKPPQIIAERVTEDGALVPGKVIQGRTVASTIPLRDIPHMEFPRVIYLHPKRPYKRMYLPVDGHGNKEWVWIANEPTSKKVANDEELKKALKQGFELKPYIIPEAPLGSADPADEPPTPNVNA